MALGLGQFEVLHWNLKEQHSDFIEISIYHRYNCTPIKIITEPVHQLETAVYAVKEHHDIPITTIT
jgi:hypothetical protein